MEGNNTKTADSGETSVYFRQETPLTPQGPGFGVCIDPLSYTGYFWVFG